MRQKNLPAWLYNALPYLYVCSGLVTIFGLEHVGGLFSGSMLISAGVIVWTMRMQHRRYRHSRTPRGRVPAATAGLDRPGEFVRLTWRKEYECGHPLIDAQHRGLFESGNALLNAMLDVQDKLDVELMLDDLIDHVEKHFGDEEALLAQAQRPISPEHRESHRRLLDRARMLSAYYHQGELTLGDLFAFIANDVVAQHVLKEDLSFLAGYANAVPPRPDPY